MYIHIVVWPSPPPISRTEGYGPRKPSKRSPREHCTWKHRCPLVPARPLSESEADIFLTAPAWKDNKGNKKTIVWSQLLLLWCRECICQRNKHCPAVRFLGLLERAVFEHSLLKELARPRSQGLTLQTEGRGHFQSCYLSLQQTSNFHAHCSFRMARWRPGLLAEEQPARAKMPTLKEAFAMDLFKQTANY